MNNLFIIIPARLNSKRLPNKVLKKINGKSLVHHIWEKLQLFPNVYIATDSVKVVQEAKKIKGNYIFSEGVHINGTERCNEAADKLNLDDNDIIINVQCDELNINPQWIIEIYELLNRSKNEMIATVSSNLDNESKKFWESYTNNPSNVDVLFDNDFFAIDFKRANNHDFRKSKQFENLKVGHHIGIYGYQKKTLSKLCNLNKSKREINEKLEQLRWIENNYKIKCINSSSEHFGFAINTKEDLDRIRKQNIL